MSSPGEEQPVIAEELVVLSKFEGDPLPENEFERIHIKNGEVVALERIENGKVVFTEEFPPKPDVDRPTPPRRPGSADNEGV